MGSKRNCSTCAFWRARRSGYTRGTCSHESRAGFGSGTSADYKCKVWRKRVLVRIESRTQKLERLLALSHRNRRADAMVALELLQRMAAMIIDLEGGS